MLKALFAIKNRHSVLGTYGFNANGDTTLKAYGLYKVGSDGNPLFAKVDAVIRRRRPRSRAPAVGQRQPRRRALARAGALLVHFNGHGSKHSARPQVPPLVARSQGGPGVAGQVGPDRRARGDADRVRDLRPGQRLSDGLRARARRLRPRPHAAGQQPRAGSVQRRHLGADRDRLHAGLRHHRADQLRPRRRVHDRLVHGQRLLDGDRAGAHDQRRGDGPGAAAHADGDDARVRPAQRADRACRLPSAAPCTQAGAADHRGRLLLHPAERRPVVARRFADRRLGPDQPGRHGVYDLRCADRAWRTSLAIVVRRSRWCSR